MRISVKNTRFLVRPSPSDVWTWYSIILKYSCGLLNRQVWAPNSFWKWSNQKLYFWLEEEIYLEFSLEEETRWIFIVLRDRRHQNRTTRTRKWKSILMNGLLLLPGGSTKLLVSGCEHWERLRTDRKVASVTPENSKILLTIPYISGHTIAIWITL